MADGDHNTGEGTIDGRFELDALLGRGGMGEVWRARQVPLGRRVAIKLLREEYSALPHLRRRFAREARAVARLNHEHIASIFDFGQDGTGRMFIAMEYIQGRQLIEAVRMGVSVRQVVELAWMLLGALAHAHARGVVHRDLKPENVLMAGMDLPEALGEPKLVDFGIATLRDEHGGARETGQDQVVGTPLYMSPEQASGERHLSPRTDIYSLGMILYELLSGSHPFEAEDSLKVMSDQVHRQLPPLRPRPGLEVPDQLELVILRALTKRPAGRWDSAAAMRDALEPVRHALEHDEQARRPPRSVFEQGVIRPGTGAPIPPRGQTLQVEGGLERQEAPTRPDLPGGAPTRIEEVRPQIAELRATPFVGRSAQREELLSMAGEIGRTGQGRVLLLEGEAGVGKTRLAMWLKETLEEQGRFRGHIGVFTRGGGDGLIGLQEVFESVFRARGMPRDRLKARARLKLTDWGAAPVDEEIEALLDFLRPGHSGAGRDEVFGAGRLFASLARQLEVAATAQPRLIILDDIHWAGAELVDFLDFLAMELRHRRIPLLVIGTLHSEELGGRPGLRERLELLSSYADDILEHRALARLDDHESEALVRASLPAEPELIEAISERGAGNPLHLVLLLRHLSQEGLLELGSRGRWRARDLEVVRAAVPPSLVDLFRARLRRLAAREDGAGEALRGVLARAAVLGRRFSYDALLILCELEGDEAVRTGLDASFDQLLAEGLITEVVGRGEEWYTFGHKLLRDVLLTEELGPAQRRRLHRLAAQALERLAGPNSAQRAAEIARHWRQGRRPGEAIEWAWRAAQTSRRGWRPREALEGYQMCAGLMEQQLGLGEDEAEARLIQDRARFERGQVNRSRYLRALVYAGDLEEGFGDFEQAETSYRRVVRMCGRPDGQPVEVLVPLCQAWLGLGHVAWQRGDFPAAHWAFGRVHELLSAAGLAPDIVNSALRGLARVAWHRGEYDEATELARRALEQADELGEEGARAESLWILGEVARMLGMRARAEEYFEESLEIYEAAGIPNGIARNLLSHAQLARYHKDFGRARSLYERALERYERLGDRRGQGMCLNGLGEIARFEGELELARSRYLRALQIFEGIGAQYDVAITYTNLGLMELRRQDLAAGEGHLQAALSLVVDNDYPYLLAGIGYNLALIKTMRGEEDRAAEILEPVWAMNDRVPIPDLDFAEPLELLGKLRAEEGSRREALALWERARAIYEELNLREDLARLDGLLANLRALEGAGEDEVEVEVPEES